MTTADTKTMQEYKITNTSDNFSVFFVSRAFESAHKQVLAYVERNTEKFPMQVYRINLGIGPKWIPVDV